MGGESLAVGMQRLSLQQLELAIEGLTDGADVDSAVHEARKAIKRLRALLRLVRSEIGDRVYRYENVTLRDAARLVAGVRDGAVAPETVSRLADRFQGAVAAGVFDDMAERLDRRAARIRRRVLDESDAVDRLVAVLAAAHRRFAGWPTDDEAAKAYGTAIRNRFGSIGPGLARTYARGRREMTVSYRSPTVERFHRWRKRVKYLRHQVEIVVPLWPELLGTLAVALDELGTVLGDEHDLACLLELLAIDPDLSPDSTERSLFAALAQHRRAELQLAARVMGTRIYAEEPEAFVDRFEAYWDSSNVPTGVGIYPIP